MSKNLEDVFKKTDEIIKDGAETKITIGNKTIIVHKNIYKCGILGDLEKIGNKLELYNTLNTSQKIREIEITENEVIINAMDGSDNISFPKNLDVYYEPWTLDRGSYLIYIDKFECFGKLATEFDIVKII